MCCLSGQFAASLIRGDPVSEFEQVLILFKLKNDYAYVP